MASPPAEFQSAPEAWEAIAADLPAIAPPAAPARSGEEPGSAWEGNSTDNLAEPWYEEDVSSYGAESPWADWDARSAFEQLTGWFSGFMRAVGLTSDRGVPAAVGTYTSAPISLYENTEVRKFMRLFLDSHREAFLRGLARAGQFIPMIQKIFAREGLPSDLAYLAIVESNLNPRALSPKRAAGLWQFMQETAVHFGLRVEPWYDERLDPVLSTEAAARMLRYLHGRYGNWELALAAYNAGESRVNQAMRTTRASGEQDFWNLPLPVQTRRYVPSFIAVALIYNDLEAHGFAPFEPESTLNFEVAEGPFYTTLSAIAQRTAIPEAVLVELNPAWRQGLIPPMHQGNVLLRLPAGGKRRIEAALAKRPFPPPRLVTHRVSPGETLSGIAERYGVDIAVILGANRIPNHNLLRYSRRLLIPLPGEGGPPATARDKT